MRQDYRCCCITWLCEFESVRVQPAEVSLAIAKLVPHIGVLFNSSTLIPPSWAENMAQG